jgi:diguanylate cyclase (GGDEF)-like protein
MVLRDTGLQVAIGVADLLRVAIGTHPLVLREKQLRVTISAGVAECVGRGGISSDLLRAADQQLYRAKQSGRDRVSPEK